MSRVTVYNPPAGGRPSGYNQAAAGGGLVAVSGQIADAGVIAGSGGFVEEFRSALEHVASALRSAGATPSDVLTLRIFVGDLSVYESCRGDLGPVYRSVLEGHYPASTLVEVSGILGGAQVEIEALAVCSRQPAQVPESPATGSDVWPVTVRLRLAPADARYAGGLVAGSKAMEVFADLETELALIEGGDEGLCVAYQMVEFLTPLRVGDFVLGRARIDSRGRTSREVEAELYKVGSVDEDGRGGPLETPELAARARATIVVGTSAQTQD